LQVVGDDLRLVPAPVATTLERADDLRERKDPFPEERAVHRPERHALHVADLDRVDPAGGVAADRLQEAALPARVEEIEDISTPRSRASRELAGIVERVDEREVLPQRVDHLDREPDAGRGRLGEETCIAVAEDARGALPRFAVPAAAQDEQRVAGQTVNVIDRPAHTIEPLPD